MRYKNTSTKLQLSFKKRYKIQNTNYFKDNNPKNYIKLIVIKPFLFYFVYFKLIRKGLKNLYAKSYLLKNKIHIYLTLMTNFPISKKSKNARMGKGKGSLVSWACRLNTGFCLLSCKGINNINLILIQNYINKILSNKVKIFIPKNYNCTKY